ncbi:hypothetical protein PIB30_034534 [Stylosanthes scabra]|uniref:Uncharacterized protein n=1 Tax=Stylosanthes scabra TaxID=79078 RepID=A0ABU6RD08_9FABA|nr:hypothetical protein [Stylosanthes scabra]
MVIYGAGGEDKPARFQRVGPGAACFQHVTCYVERQTVLEELGSVSEDDFEANYEVPEEEEEGDDEAVDAAVHNAKNPLASQHPFGVPSCMRQLDLEGISGPEFPEYAHIAIVALEDGELMIGMEYVSRKAVVSAVRKYTIDRGVDYTVYNGRHTCAIGTISQDHSKLDSDIVANVIMPLVESDHSLKVKTVIAQIQAKFNYTISYRKALLGK